MEVFMIVCFKKLHQDAIIPKYQTQYASGFDLHAIEDVKIYAGETKLVKTGLAVKLPKNTELQIRARSGLALKTPYLIKNGVGTVDEDYRGEIGVIIHNISQTGDIMQIKKGDRIAQGIIAPVVRCQIFEADELDITERGTGGFGHTGIGG